MPKYSVKGIYNRRSQTADNSHLTADDSVHAQQIRWGGVGWGGGGRQPGKCEETTPKSAAVRDCGCADY